MVWSEWYYPTYGNTNVHVAFAQHMLRHWEYPLANDYSYGGGIPALYVPGYRILLAITGGIFGIDLAQRLLVMLFALLLPIGFFLFARELFGDYAGVIAAFFASLPTELLVYTVRPLPQALGLALLPFAFYAIAADKRKTALALTLAIALIHQEAVAFLAAGAFAFAALDFAFKVVEKKKIVLPEKSAWTALLCWAVALMAYVGWHFIATGNPNVFGIAQFQHHEGGVVSPEYLLEKTGYAVGVLSVLGIVFLAFRNAFGNASKNKVFSKELFLAALVITGVLFVKNDVFGIRVFMDRFVVFLQIPLVVLAALGLAQLLCYVLHFDSKTLSPTESS